jgi:hypothetical protein
VPTINNAAPMTIFNGIKDDSTDAVTQTPITVPDHCPLFFIYAQKGRNGAILTGGASLTQEYGTASLDDTQQYYNHQTALLDLVNAAGNACYVCRIVPDDAPPAATIRFSLDLLPTAVPVYERNPDGSLALNPTTGDPIPTSATVQGYSAMWVATMIPVTDGESTFGAGTEGPGSQVDATTSTTSLLYPIFDIQVSSQGAWGNNAAIRLWAPTLTTGGGIDSSILTGNQVYPFRAAFLSRTSATASATIGNTVSGASYVDWCLKPNTVTVDTATQLYAENAIVPAYQSLNNQNGTPDTVSQFSDFYVYDEYVADILALVYAAELPHINSFSDFTGSGFATEGYLFNLLSGVSSQNVPYETYQLVTNSTNPVRFTQNTQVYAVGGGDGTLSATAFDTAVATQMENFLDPANVWQDMVKYPFSDFYDTGFTVATKKTLPAFIALRPDTFLTLGLHDVIAGTVLTAAQESSLAAALLEAVQVYPESLTYGTPATRAMIVGRSGTLISGNYTERVPCTFEIGIKAANYMGASTGVWTSSASFGYGDNAIIQYMTNINVTWTSTTQQNTDWTNGLVGVQAYDHIRYYIPALKTVYNNDTSILTSYFNARIAANLEKIGNNARIAFSGVDDLTPNQVIKGVNANITAATASKYDKRVTIEPNTYQTTQDQQRGYSYTIQIKCYGDNMDTVATLYIDMYRASDLTTSTSGNTTTTTAATA